MKNIKGTIGIVFVVIVLSLLFIGLYQTATKPTAEDVYNNLFSNYDQDNVNRLKASITNDSYCANCKKYMEGSHRICVYCGQYL